MEVKRAIIELLSESPHVTFEPRSLNKSNEFFGPYLQPNAKHESFLSPAQFGCFTGLLLIFFSNYQIDKDKSLNRLWHFLQSPLVKEFLFVTLCFVVWMLFMPLNLLIVGSFTIFKAIDANKLKHDDTKRFKGILNGEDVVWACEDALSKSIINVLAYVRAPTHYNENFSRNLLTSIRERISTELMKTNRFPKMFYRRRKSESGYFYWTDENQLTIDDYVRFSKGSENVINEEDFKREMSAVLDETLPADNTALWECLVGQQMVKVGDCLKYPVSFEFDAIYVPISSHCTISPLRWFSECTTLLVMVLHCCDFSSKPLRTRKTLIFLLTTRCFTQVWEKFCQKKCFAMQLT